LQKRIHINGFNQVFVLNVSLGFFSNILLLCVVVLVFVSNRCGNVLSMGGGFFKKIIDEIYVFKSV
jgi:hypothetical protein